MQLFAGLFASTGWAFHLMVKKYKCMCPSLYGKLVVEQVNIPKEVKTYCPKCKKHQIHAVSLYKAGKRRAQIGRAHV